MKKKAIVVIGGSGFARTLKGTRKSIQTRFGKVDVLISEIAGRTIYALSRHGESHTIPPHKINHKANIWLAKEVDADAILTTTAVGIVNNRTIPGGHEYEPGELFLCTDVMALNLRLADASAVTFIDEFEAGKPIHPDSSKMFSTRLQIPLILAAQELEIPLRTFHTVLGLTYGPRYETPAEIRALRTLGVDLVGMTALFEAILANEIGKGYQTIAIGTNWAAGVTNKKLSHPEVEKIMAQRSEDISRLLTRTIEMI